MRYWYIGKARQTFSPSDILEVTGVVDSDTGSLRDLYRYQTYPQGSWSQSLEEARSMLVSSLQDTIVQIQGSIQELHNPGVV